MLTSLRIQNFRSIRDASVKLGRVNLFIGPNNSGKSNFLKGFNLFSSIADKFPQPFSIQNTQFNLLLNRSEFTLQNINSINFSFRVNSEESIEHFFSYKNKEIDILGQDFISTDIFLHSPRQFSNEEVGEFYISFRKDFDVAREILNETILYRPDPHRMQLSAHIKRDYKFSEDGSNIISFLFNLNQNFRKSYQKLEQDFAYCVKSLASVSTPVVNTEPGSTEPGTFKLRFFDENDIGYWAEEVSEGVLYFLALLCIIHQPYPPKLLLLEEPEKGIHPRRIKEVMDFIFELAELRDIQIILTSHSPYVVDHFADIPECISVFDRENGETVIRNAGDIITETNEKLAAEGRKPIRYTDSLGEHWVSGFLGGVPV